MVRPRAARYGSRAALPSQPAAAILAGLAPHRKRRYAIFSHRHSVPARHISVASQVEIGDERRASERRICLLASDPSANRWGSGAAMSSLASAIAAVQALLAPAAPAWARTDVQSTSARARKRATSSISFTGVVHRDRPQSWICQ